MKKTILLSALLLTVNAGIAAEKTIYKYTDEQGVTHYSEQKLNENYKEADLPQLSVVESVPTSPESGEMTTIEDSSKQSGTNNTDISLSQPKPQENIWGTGGNLTVSIMPLSENQKQEYQVQFVLNDKKSPVTDSTSHTFELVPRGEHQVQALLITRGQYSVAGQTDKITVYMHQASKK